MVKMFTTRVHSLRIWRVLYRTEMGRDLFSQRVVNLWNFLPQNTVEAKQLKNRLMDLGRKQEQGFGLNGGAVLKGLLTSTCSYV